MSLNIDNTPQFVPSDAASSDPELFNREMEEYLDRINPTIAYRGNSLIKRAGERIQWTEHRIQEMIHCAEDPIYFIQEYVKIVQLDVGVVPFKLWDYQKDMIMSMLENRKTIIATARQVGKSTTACAFILWYILFHKHVKVAMLADKGETAREILARVKLAYSYIPKWMQSGIPDGGWNKGTILLENGSVVFAAATSSAAIRGYSINLLFLDEVAHVEGWEEFESAVLPTISSSQTAKVIMVSTPKGLNHFHKYWTLANEPKDSKDWNGYNPIKVNWNQVPYRDQKWYDETLATMSGNIDKFNQEFGVEFLGSSATLIAGWKLKDLVAKTPLHYDKGFSQYVPPITDHRYMLVADSSHGKGFDDSAFCVIDTTIMPYKVVASYNSNQISPWDFSDMIVKTALAYNKAWVLAENNDVGMVVNGHIKNDFAYEYLLYSRASGRNGKALSSGFVQGAEPGLRTTPLSKINGCSTLKSLIESDQLITNDRNTIRDLSTFVRDGTTYRADKNITDAKDDLVMALVLFAWATTEDYFKEITDIHTTMNIRDNTDKEMEQLLAPFGIAWDAADIWEEINPKRPTPMWHSDAWKSEYMHFLYENELTQDQIDLINSAEYR